MPENTEVTTQIVPQNVPPDRECDIANLSQIIKGVADFTSIQQISPNGGGSTGDSIAQQALEAANIAVAKATEAVEAIPQKRSFGAPVDVPTGDSNFAFNWAPPMPSTDYEVRGCFFGAIGDASSGQWLVIDSSKTINGCQLRLVNALANQKFSVVVEENKTP